MVIPAGQRDQRITIQAVTVEKNSLNEEVKSWWSWRRPWAKAIEEPGREYLKGGQTVAERKAVFVMLFIADLTSIHRIVWKGEIFEIDNITGTRRSGELWVHCKSTGEREA